MTWGINFRFRQYLKGSFWVVPVIGGLIGIVMAEVGLWLDRMVSVPPGRNGSTVTAVPSSIIGTLLFSFRIIRQVEVYGYRRPDPAGGTLGPLMASRASP